MISVDRFHQPTLFIVAGAPGSGKSVLLPVSAFGVDHFNADDEAAILNGNSYRDIPQSVRTEVNQRFELFIGACIAARKSFAIETTLRSTISLKQASEARKAGFYVEMHYIATESFEINLERVKKRADGGGHSAPANVLADIRDKSFSNLFAAVNSVPSPLNELTVYDNSVDNEPLRAALRISLPPGRYTLQIEVIDPPPYLTQYAELAFWH